LGRHGLGAEVGQHVHGVSLLGEKLTMGVAHLDVEVADLVDDLSAPGGRPGHHTCSGLYVWLGTIQLRLLWRLSHARSYRRRGRRLRW
jgi:hypothetical protein